MITVGVDVGGTNIRAGVVDVDGAVLQTVRTPTPHTQGELQDAVAGAVTELTRQHRVDSVGLAVAGFVAPDNRTVTFAPHLPWRDWPVAEHMERRLGLPVVVEHDTNAAALAEWRYGAGAGVTNLAYVAVGTGIGAALLVTGEPYRGEYGVAPELGHLRVVPGGRVCPCGKRGCWERYCSGTALAETAAELRGRTAGAAAADSGELTGRDVALAAQAGDPVARAAVAELARWLGEGLALVADVFDPAVVLVGGGVAGSAAQFLPDAVAHYERAVTGAPHRRLAEVRLAQLGDAAGVVGAAVVARAHAAHPAEQRA
jgi:glucokinase